MSELQTRAELLFDRVPDQAYLESCRETLASAPETPPPTTSYLVFRLEDHWFGLPAAHAGHVVTSLPLCAVPNRSRDILLGLVNWEGRLIPCVSLFSLLCPEVARRSQTEKSVILDLEGDRYVTPVDAVRGILRLPVHLVEPAPQAARQLAGIVTWEGDMIGLLDSLSLRQGLRRGLAR